MKSYLTSFYFSIFYINLKYFKFTLFPTKTIGMFSQILVKSLCHFGTFLYVILEVTSNITIAQLPPILNLYILLITFSKTSQFLLSCRVPNIKFNGSMISVENNRTNFYTLSCNILFFKFSR